MQALSLQAQFEQASNEDQQQAILQQLQTMTNADDPSVQLTVAHVCLAAHRLKEAMQCVHQGTTLEHQACCLQVYLKLDRLDLAQEQLRSMKQRDEDSILTQLCGVYVALATGSSAASDALHTLGQLSEQYGPSILLMNLTACAQLQAGQYAAAEQTLEQSRTELGATQDVDTMVNLLVAYQYQQKPTDALVQTLKQQFPNHFLSKGLQMVEGAFQRESTKYRV